MTAFRQSRLGMALFAAWGAVIGLAPHVLHHVGPLAGAALLAGAGGKALFGVIGILLSIPFLARLYRHFHTLAAPLIATAAFVALFVISTLVVSPLISGRESVQPTKSPSGHLAHHQK